MREGHRISLLAIAGMGLAYLILFPHQRTEQAAPPPGTPLEAMDCIDVAGVADAQGHAFLWWQKDFTTEWLRSISKGDVLRMFPHSLTVSASPGDTVKAEVCGYP